jgi:CBS domain containing-hemolysin-like protein
MRPALFAPESQSVDDLLHELQRRKVHMAVVLDEYGGTAGLVTIEDLLEEIVGEIQDEFDEEEPMKVEIGPGEVILDGRADIDELTELVEPVLELEDDEEYDTLGGFVYHRIGRVPVVGDAVVVEPFVITVIKVSGRRVGKVRVRWTPISAANASGGDEEK